MHPSSGWQSRGAEPVVAAVRPVQRVGGRRAVPRGSPVPRGDPPNEVHCSAQAEHHRSRRAHAVLARTVLPDDISGSLLPFLTSDPWTLTPRHAILLPSALR
jgi:hypothetical protein